MKAIVIAENRTRADVCLLPNIAVSQIRKMVGFGTSTHDRFLRFYEIPDVHIFKNRATWPEVSKGSQQCTVRNGTLFDDRIRLNVNIAANRGIYDDSTNIDKSA